MTKTIPLQAAFQASRYAQMGHADLFERTSQSNNDLAASACGLVAEEGQERLNDFELPTGWQRDDAERILLHLVRDFSDGTLMFVSPNNEQLAQIEKDGIRLHQARLDLVLAAIDHAAQSAKGHYSTAAYGEQLAFLAHHLRIGALVCIKTN